VFAQAAQRGRGRGAGGGKRMALYITVFVIQSLAVLIGTDLPLVLPVAGVGRLVFLGAALPRSSSEKVV
jgi:hypothetical protein